MSRKKWELLPEKFVENLRAFIQAEKLEDVLNAFSVTRATTFRANTLKTTSIQLEQGLTKQGFKLEKVKSIQDAFILDNKSLRELQETNEYKQGKLYVQSLSSMLPALILDPKPDEKICDLTAAPGSKTTQIAAMMKNSGEIVANDKSPIRILKLKANLTLQGATNVKVTQIPGQIFWQNYQEHFDKTLVDVPCSLEGRFNIHNPKTFRDWTPKKSKILSQTQKFLLRSAISATKKGGVIVYSTCTLSPMENEEVINWILKKEAGKVVLEKVELPEIETMKGLINWKDKKYKSQLSHALRIFPSNFFEGFFIAKLRKLEGN